MSKNKKIISVLGATGSIGNNTLEIIRKFPDKFKLDVVSAGTDYKQLYKIYQEFKPKIIAINDENAYFKLKALIDNDKVTLLVGEDGIKEAASYNTDAAILGISGIAALKAMINLLSSTKTIGIANKESIICGGKILQKNISSSSCKVVPVDSEHSAIFQTINFEQLQETSSVVLTASGGPFLNKSIKDLENINPAEALKHPTWKMGKKISIDSATMVNKALEMIEAFYLFPININQIKVVIHPESIIHCFINFIDGTSKAFLSNNDMKKSISYAMTYPERLAVENHFNIEDYSSFSFHKVDKNRFEAIDIGFNVLKEEKSAAIIFNAANEVLVDAFLNHKIKFNDIIGNIKIILNKMIFENVESFEHIFTIDQQARYNTKQLIG